MNQINRKKLEEHLGEERAVERVSKTVRKFEKYLEGKSVDEVEPEDLSQFLEAYNMKYVTKFNLNHLGAYYKATGNEKMERAVKEMRYKFTPPFKLSQFEDIDEEYIDILDNNGIKTNNQLLEVASTDEERKELSNETGIPLKTIEQLTKLSDLSRIRAVKTTRAKLYYEAGVDTVQKIAEWDPTEFRKMIERYVEESGFPGEPTLQKEAEFTVDFARKLHRKVDFE